MEPPDTVLVLTERLDPTADLVVAELNRRGVPVVRFDTAEFPGALHVSAEFDGRWHGVVRTGTHLLDLDTVCGAYYRRPSAFVFPAGMTEPELSWAGLEARVGLGGILATVPHWLNHPSRIGYAEYKPVQLAAAASAGLDTPRTLVTNDPADARRFAAQVGQVVYKPFSATTERDGQRAFVYTTPVSAGDIDDSVRLTAHLFQEWVPKAHEVRLTVVDDRFFAARLTAGSEAARVDWRSDYPALAYAVEEEVPTLVRTAALRMLAHLRLRFAAMDFVVTPAGEWVFLDLNPNGQWAWIEHETGLPLCSAIADALTQVRRHPADAVPL